MEVRRASAPPPGSLLKRKDVKRKEPLTTPLRFTSLRFTPARLASSRPPGHSLWRPDYLVTTTISTRRFFALAVDVFAGSLGLASPKPSAVMWLASTPLLTRYFWTASARA